LPERLNIGIVGAGARGLWTLGHEFVRRIGDVRVLAFCDPRPDLREHLDYVKSDVTEKIGPVDYDIAALRSIDDLLAIDAIQMVFLATPDHLHVEYAEQIMDSGRDLLIEKPMATTVEGVNRIAEAQKRTGRKLYVGFPLRSNVLHSRARQLVTSGAIGRPISYNDYFALGRGYFRSRGRFREFTGSLLAEKATHSFDLMSWLMGSDPARVSCFSRTLVFKPNPEAADRCCDCKLTATCPDYVDAPRDAVGRDGDPRDLCVYNSEKDNDDTDVITLEYASGALGSFVEVMYSPSVERRYSIVGDRGKIRASEETGIIQVQKLGSKEVVEEQLEYPPGGHRGSDPQLVTDAIAYFRGETPEGVQPTVHAGRTSVLTALAALKSSDENRVVDLSELT